MKPIDSPRHPSNSASCCAVGLSWFPTLSRSNPVPVGVSSRVVGGARKPALLIARGLTATVDSFNPSGGDSSNLNELGA
jgi:hypothetical protein